jgi:hypothetical protein
MTRIKLMPLGLCLLASVPALCATPKIDPEADQILRKMSDFLSKQQKLSFVADHQTEAVLKSGQKIEFDAESQVKAERPNKIRSDRKGEVAKDMSLYYDGKSISLYGRGINYYATTPAPATMDKAIDFARTKLDLEAPAADLLYSNPYQALTEDTVSGMVVGKATIDGKPAYHLAFRGNMTDWQIWIADGDKPLPLKYVITSKKVTKSPEFAVELHDWDLSPQFAPDTFTFSPPQGSSRIEFAGTAEKHKTKGSG